MRAGVFTHGPTNRITGTRPLAAELLPRQAPEFFYINLVTTAHVA